MTTKRIVLTFPPPLVGQPITSHLVKEYDLMLNILRANVKPNEEGRMVLELSGGKKALEGGIDYLKGLGINVESLAHDIKWHTDKCTHCTACIPACPSGAMTVDRKTWQVSFDRDRCIACELCIRICPFNALEIQF
jgi:L-aspartate semialdehyde sulfurtransferase ferredoxin